MDGSGSPSDDSEATVPLRGVANALIAVCAVFAVIGVLLAAFGEPVGKASPPRPGTAGKVPGATASSKPPQRPPRTPSTSTARPTTTPPTATPSASTGSPTTPPPASQPPVTDPRPAARGHVVVFNETVHRGLAARFAAQLQSEGWSVDGIGTWRGNVPATTVYYPPGLEPRARALMAEHDEVGRIRPAFPGISRTAITVILAKDFPVGSLTVGDVPDDAFPQVVPGSGSSAAQ
jgi:hypothetical protein